ncbi:pheromone precursor with four tandem repeats of a putative pheromone peptide [Melampsora larici-populina 98AG31]|uniref:Pheromone with four tandem repeats of a putative pheromone peptide n=1 Tax=Melampsora larici-populina (strain 98AG31 / pathotype 3-4-7) TaxID=747676 RepID=F4SAN8_MELLP|nr:pheromone precursor with four tandem repeats of a putative pheromone peptide [Melampsora larici-populina 98AG31]EGF98299.1 pheromone precursor with four tandem repeats of a putative pheromone peptide [Melampsora larici-populina 98AG31]
MSSTNTQTTQPGTEVAETSGPEYREGQIGGSNHMCVVNRGGQIGGSNHICVLSRGTRGGQIGGGNHMCVVSKQIGGSTNSSHCSIN